MKLQIPIKINRFNIDIRFIKWLMPYIKHQILKNINNRQLYVIDKYIEDSLLLEEYKLKNIKFSSRKAIMLAINNLIINKRKDAYEIEIDNNILYPGYSISLENICKLINLGNMDIKGYPIIINAFNHITDNLKRYCARYYQDGI